MCEGGGGKSRADDPTAFRVLCRAYGGITGRVYENGMGEGGNGGTGRLRLYSRHDRPLCGNYVPKTNGSDDVAGVLANSAEMGDII